MSTDLHMAFYQEVATSVVTEAPEKFEGEIDPRVAKGCELLDREHSGWADKINLRTFDLQSSTDCVIGQLFGDYDAVGKVLSQEDFPSYMISDAEKEHGFIVDKDDFLGQMEASEAWYFLEKAWVIEIGRRQTKR